MSNEELKEVLARKFRLEGEEVIRLPSGKPLCLKPQKDGYKFVQVSDGPGRRWTVKYHRLKFFLAHGWLPEEVDHRDTDTANDLLGNLRPSTRQTNAQNRNAFMKASGLPRGVTRSGKRRFKAKVTHGGTSHYLGSFASPFAASEVVEKFLRDVQGEFYKERD